MNELIVKIQKVSREATLPQYEHEGDSGMDVTSVVSATIKPTESRLIRTGLKIEVPAGYEVQVRPRSGLALRHAVTVLNTPGTIDSSYRGEIGVILVNHGKEDFVVTIGMKVAQLVVQQVVKATIVEESSLSNTTRNTGGFGSTGR